MFWLIAVSWLYYGTDVYIYQGKDGRYYAVVSYVV